MSERQGATFLQVLAEGFSAPLVALCALAGVVVAVAGRERPPAPSDVGGEVVRVDPEAATPTTETATDAPPPETEEPAGLATPDEVQALIDRGEFARAERRARAARLDALADRALLLDGLTRGIQPGRLAAEPVVRVTTLEGEVFLGVVEAEVDDRLTLVLRDGRQRALARAKVRQREALTPEAATLALEDALKRDRAALGARAPGLALHRLSHQAFAAGLRATGARLLIEALRTPEGQVLVDMFGTGDVERLHAARRRLADDGAEPVAQLPTDTPPPAPVEPVSTPPVQPQPPVEPLPQPPRPPQPPEPEPEPEPAPVIDVEAIFAHASWRGAETAYRTGLQLYRSAFDEPQHAAGTTIRAALAQFRKAQDLLEALFRQMPEALEHHEVERRVVELNALVLDCTKRLGTD